MLLKAVAKIETNIFSANSFFTGKSHPIKISYSPGKKAFYLSKPDTKKKVHQFSCNEFQTCASSV
jgi:hypothetical protein